MIARLFKALIGMISILYFYILQGIFLLILNLLLIITFWSPFLKRKIQNQCYKIVNWFEG